MNRRDLLKFFGAGAVIAPVVGGMAAQENHVRLVEAPKVERIEPPKLVEVDVYQQLLNAEQLDVTIFMRNRKRGTVARMECSAFVASVKANRVEVTSLSTMAESPWRRTFLASHSVTLEATGQIRQVMGT